MVDAACAPMFTYAAACKQEEKWTIFGVGTDGISAQDMVFIVM